jgi:GST-like protein
MIELYHWEPSGESLALLICLKEQGLEFRGHYVDMFELEHHAPKYLELSPKAQVPLLVAEGEVMSDVGFAMQYLAERYPGFAPDDASGWYDLQPAGMDGLVGPAGGTGRGRAVARLELRHARCNTCRRPCLVPGESGGAST